MNNRRNVSVGVASVLSNCFCKNVMNLKVGNQCYLYEYLLICSHVFVTIFYYISNLYFIYINILYFIFQLFFN